MKVRNVIPIILFICGCNLLGTGTPIYIFPVSEDTLDVSQDFTDANLDTGADLIDRDIRSGDSGTDLRDGGIADVPIADLKPEDMAVTFCNETRNLRPVLYWSFDNSEDGTTFPNVMNQSSPEVALSNSVALEEGAFGSGLKFNGQDSAVSVAHDPTFEVANGTISLWFLKSGLSVCPDTTTGCGLFSKDAFGYGEGGHFTVAMTGENTIRVRLQSADTTFQIVSQPFLNRGVFQHVAVTFGSGGLKLFLNGVEEGQNSYIGGLDHGENLPTIHNFEAVGLGWSAWRAEPGTSDPKRGFFEGTIDEISFFDRELTTGEIQILSNGCGD